MTEEISVGESISGREVIIRYEKGKWWVVLGEEYVRYGEGQRWVMLGEEYVCGLWPKSRAVRFAKSIVNNRRTRT
jgi:hypothetical protein